MKIQIEKTTKKSKTAKKTAPVPCYKREDIESILTNIMFVSVSLAAVLLTLSLLITVIKH
jgi:hypothetical protein